ncbi:hypothetical protein BWQ96_08652 [Gracilariopsis chorda]|uniref:SGNH hydrolase-type esterase domain-containing protein n=1 Tax=Gracilariopsis chorda TaxID=448386 RepID=A0A2V3IHU8_9FLOR|nr:hypothetical protein BWQ96_08652 [Gracilariopsis chorda]|eukprot:PXF41641.1 hypothetical protein BWQ96_08652 [Gracilariopsis chorda]
MAVLDRIFDTLGVIYLYFRLALHRVLLFISQTVEYSTMPVSSQYHRTILLLGDGTAEGIGDAFGHTGLCSRINHLIRKERETSNLRMLWSVITCGKMFSTAADWRPTAQNGPTLFHRFIRRKPFSNAHVVVLFFGMHDDLTDQRFPQDVADIARALALLGKHVIVADLPNVYSHKDERYAVVTSANSRMKHLVQQVAEEIKPSAISVSLGIETMKTTAMGAHTLRQEKSCATFNGNGYRLLARDVYEQLVLAAKRVEWSHWKGKIPL